MKKIWLDPTNLFLSKLKNYKTGWDRFQDYSKGFYTLFRVFSCFHVLVFFLHFTLCEKKHQNTITRKHKKIDTTVDSTVVSMKVLKYLIRRSLPFNHVKTGQAFHLNLWKSVQITNLEMITSTHLIENACLYTHNRWIIIFWIVKVVKWLIIIKFLVRIR